MNKSKLKEIIGNKKIRRSELVRMLSIIRNQTWKAGRTYCTYYDNGPVIAKLALDNYIDLLCEPNLINGVMTHIKVCGINAKGENMIYVNSSAFVWTVLSIIVLLAIGFLSNNVISFWLAALFL